MADRNDVLGVGEAIDVLAEPVRTLLGPAARELGEAWGDKVRSWRDQRRLERALKAAAMIRAKGISPKMVDPSILFPLLDAASLAEEDGLKQKWDAMLANAADPTSKVVVQPAFPALLSQLTPIEVRLLDAMGDGDGYLVADMVSAGPETLWQVIVVTRDRFGKVAGEQSVVTMDPSLLWPLLDNMERLKLILPSTLSIGSESVVTTERGTMEQSHLGRALYRACRYGQAGAVSLTNHSQ